MPLLRLPLGAWMPDRGENANPGLLVAKNMFPYTDSYVPSGLRQERTTILPGIESRRSTAINTTLTGMHVNPNVSTGVEIRPPVLNQGTLYYGIGSDDRLEGEIFAVDVDVFSGVNWPVALVTGGTLYTVGEEGWHFVSFGADEIAVSGHGNDVLIRVDGTGDFVKCFDTVAFPSTGEPKPKFVGVADNRLWFANIANTGSPGPTGPDPNVNLVWWGATDSPRLISNEAVDPADGTGFQVLIDDHGPITGMYFAREFGLIFKRDIIYRVDYGGSWGPEFKALAQKFGTRHSQSIIGVGEVVYFWGPNGPARYRYDEVEDLGVGIFSRSLTSDTWIATDPTMRVQDFGDTSVANSISNPYSIQVAYSVASGNVIWRYVTHENQVRLLCFNHLTGRPGILERDQVINDSNVSTSRSVLGLVTIPETGIDFSPARDILFIEEFDNDVVFDTRVYTLGTVGTEAHDHAQALGTGFFANPEGKPNSWKIVAVRPVFTVARGQSAPVPTIKVFSRQFPSDTPSTVVSNTLDDRNGWVKFGSDPFRSEKRIQIEFDVSVFSSHPAVVLAEIESLDVLWTEGPEL